jgi:hypothetical protein
VTWPWGWELEWRPSSLPSSLSFVDWVTNGEGQRSGGLYRGFLATFSVPSNHSTFGFHSTLVFGMREWGCGRPNLCEGAQQEAPAEQHRRPSMYTKPGLVWGRCGVSAGGVSQVLALVCMCMSVWVCRVKVLFCFVIVLQRLTAYCNVSSVYDARIACWILRVYVVTCVILYIWVTAYFVLLFLYIYIYIYIYITKILFNCRTVSLLIVPTRILGFGTRQPKQSMAYIGGVSPLVFISSALSLDY